MTPLNPLFTLSKEASANSNTLLHQAAGLRKQINAYLIQHGGRDKLTPSQLAKVQSQEEFLSLLEIVVVQLHKLNSAYQAECQRLTARLTRWHTPDLPEQRPLPSL
jgi:hypothetical protein